MRWFFGMKQNKGFTIVELLCSIAILSSITLAVSTALVVTARNYDRGTTEARLQQEAQFTANRIEGLIIDALSEVTFDDSTDTLTVVNPEGKYMIALVDDELVFAETRDDGYGGEHTETGVLAENVSRFHVDASKFATNHTVQMVLGISVRGREYLGDYQITSRNGARAVAGAETALIVAPGELTLEPNQEYEFSYSVLGITDQTLRLNNYGDISDDNKLLSSNDAATQVSVSGDRIRIKIGQNETGSGTGACQLLLNTNRVSEGTTEPLDKKGIVIHIRRVQDIDIHNRTIGGSLVTGHVIQLKPLIMGSSLDKVPGTDYDLDYVDPYGVDWSLSFELPNPSGTGWFNADSQKDAFFELNVNPDQSCSIMLKQAMPYRSRLRVKATAKHPAGANKTHTVYGHAEKEIEFVSNALVSFPSSFQRGNDFIWNVADGFSADALKNTYGMGSGEFKWMMRYRAKNSDGTFGTWACYRLTQELGVVKKINANETMLFEPDTEYEIQFTATVIDGPNKKLMWPIDDTVLNGLKAVDPAWTAGWMPGLAQTPVDEYSGTYSLGKVNMVFGANSTYGIAENSSRLGSMSNPIEVSTGNHFVVTMDSRELHQNQFSFTPVLKKWNPATGSFENASAVGFALQVDNSGIKIDNVNSSANGLYKLDLVMTGNRYRDGYVVDNILNPHYNQVIVKDYVLEDVGYFKFN